MRVSREKLTRKRATRRAHDWKMKSHTRLEIFVSVLQVRPTHEGLVKLSIWQKVRFCFTTSLSTLYIPLLPTNCKECFQRENCQDIVYHVKNICHLELTNPLTKRTLLVIGQIQDVFNTLRNKSSSPSIETMQICPRIK